MADPFAELAALLAIAAVVAALAVRLRQPVLIAYIVVGIAVGPAGFDLVRSHDQINVLAQVGVAVLLFVVGLKLDLTRVRDIGTVALATGLGQLAFTIVFGFIIILALGKGVTEAFYVAVALTFSSTIIIVKLLSDKGELDTLHGRIAIGFLIVQDIAVVLAMMAMSALGSGSDAPAIEVAASLIGRIAAAAALMYIMMRYVLPVVLHSVARSQELLLIFAIAWGTGLAALGEWVGFSQEAGAFLAGFSLASTRYREAISARLTGIRDFLLLFFFIDLGSELDFSTLGAEIGSALILSLFVLIGNPLIVMAIMGVMGYRKRTGFLAGLTVAQISEFSIVFVAMGIGLGHISGEALGLTTLVGVITITLSTYMILYSHPLYRFLAPVLGLFERRHPYREVNTAESGDSQVAPQVLVLGLGRYGLRLARHLRNADLEVLGVDCDPDLIRRLAGDGLPVRFGDGHDPSFLDSLPLTGLGWIVSTLPDVDSNRVLLYALAERGFTGEIAIVARDDQQGQQLWLAGAPIILYPVRDAVDFAAENIIEIMRKHAGTSTHIERSRP
ncbi:sodium:proton exchanger [Thiocapsa imhoffii]|uniref:Sodium:proton exchanger n=1 Tax=Thiocapsa imhoffii TaxID=382777 RepID=A0A9X0WG90_9GAMM|nr:cation:proton antiporter [Thiocapsa imhoffii]MBK1644048.1 sodium:proton exchanger [Thiocapsa imhoffii]